MLRLMLLPQVRPVPQAQDSYRLYSRLSVKKEARAHCSESTKVPKSAVNRFRNTHSVNQLLHDSEKASVPQTPFSLLLYQPLLPALF